MLFKDKSGINKKIIFNEINELIADLTGKIFTLNSHIDNFLEKEKRILEKIDDVSKKINLLEKYLNIEIAEEKTKESSIIHKDFSLTLHNSAWIPPAAYKKIEHCSKCGQKKEKSNDVHKKA